MLAIVEITPWHWAGFLVLILFLLALDLGVFHREAREISCKEALAWTTVWFTLAMIFASCLVPLRGEEEALEFITGYIIELSLSMDNVFVIALIFGYFRIPPKYQHRVLFWGILGALVMRGIMIVAGAELVEMFKGTLVVFGLFLIVSGFKILGADEDGVEPEKNPFIRFAKKRFSVTDKLCGQSFIAMVEGKKVLTPLALVLIMVETTDLIFAVDSIPAIFGVTQKKFIIFTSNVFAILGLRSLYFALAGVMQIFRYLKYGLCLVLVFIGVKMVIMHWFKISTEVSLCAVGVILLTSVGLSIRASRKDTEQDPPAPEEAA